MNFHRTNEQRNSALVLGEKAFHDHIVQIIMLALES